MPLKILLADRNREKNIKRLNTSSTEKMFIIFLTILSQMQTLGECENLKSFSTPKISLRIDANLNVRFKSCLIIRFTGSLGILARGKGQFEEIASWGTLTCRISWAQFLFLFIFI